MIKRSWRGWPLSESLCVQFPAAHPCRVLAPARAGTYHTRAHNYDNLRAAVVRILVGGERTLTPRFAALASHYLLEPCFCRPGEGHDKGGVEARGKALRRQALTPIPSAPTLAAINQTLLARMDARLETGVDRTGATIGARFTTEAAHFRPLPVAFVAEATTLSTVSPRALVRVDGAVYSVPCRWAGLDLITRLGAALVTIVGREGGLIVHPRKRGGQRSIDYRHYLPELARKPQAVRQVLPELLRDLGPPFPAVWDHFHAAHAPREAARLFAKVLGQLDTHGFARVASPRAAAHDLQPTYVERARPPGCVPCTRQRRALHRRRADAAGARWL
jgi:hypothetical protein